MNFWKRKEARRRRKKLQWMILSRLQGNFRGKKKIIRLVKMIGKEKVIERRRYQQKKFLGIYSQSDFQMLVNCYLIGFNL